MQRLLAKHLEGLAGFEGDLTPTKGHEPEVGSALGTKLKYKGCCASGTYLL